MSRAQSIAVAITILVVTAAASFAVGYRYAGDLDQYELIQFALAAAWAVAAIALVLLFRGNTARLGIWLLIALSAPFALLYPGQMIALLVSFSLRGFV